MDTGLYEDEEERGRHSSAMQNLVKGEGVDEEYITRVYEEVLMEYKKDATIDIFLPIIVSKKVKDLLRQGNKKI
jgi:hypothetical protein